MKIHYKNYTIECMNNTSLDDRFSGKTLVAFKTGTSDFLISQWWDGKIPDGVKLAKKLIDKKIGKEK